MKRMTVFFMSMFTTAALATWIPVQFDTQTGAMYFGAGYPDPTLTPITGFTTNANDTLIGYKETLLYSSVGVGQGIVSCSDTGARILAGDRLNGSRYRSSNSGASFAAIAPTSPSANWFANDVSGDGENMFIAAWDAGSDIYVATNFVAAAPFYTTATPTVGAWRDMQLDQDGSRMITLNYASGGQAYHGFNMTNWSAAGVIPFGIACAINDNGNYAYAGGSDGLYKAVGAAAFTNQIATNDVAKVRCSDSGAVVFYTGDDGNFISSDYGETWTQTGSGINMQGAVDVSDDGVLVLAASETSGLYLSINGGASFAPIATPLRFYSLEIYSNNTAYATATNTSTGAGGVYRLDNLRTTVPDDFAIKSQYNVFTSSNRFEGAVAVTNGALAAAYAGLESYYAVFFDGSFFYSIGGTNTFRRFSRGVEYTTLPWSSSDLDNKAVNLFGTEHRVESSSVTINSGSPDTFTAYNSHVVFDVSTTTATGTVTVSGYRVNENDNTVTNWTEDVSITSNGQYQTSAKFIGSCTNSTSDANIVADIILTTYKDFQNQDFIVKDIRMSFKPSNPVWDIGMDFFILDNNGQTNALLDGQFDFSSTDPMPRAANGINGHAKSLINSRTILGSENEGIIVRITGDGDATPANIQEFDLTIGIEFP